MKYVRVRRRGPGRAWRLRAMWCSSVGCRLRGLMFRRNLPAGEALLLVEAADSRLATAIHMLGVPFAIAVVWIDGDGRVVDKALARPWRLFYAPRAPARYVLEARPEFGQEIEVGDEVDFEPLAD